MKVYKKGELDIFKDERGLIANMLPHDVVIKSVLYCSGKKGSVRGSHWHKKDSHYCFVIKGSIRYESQVGNKNKEIQILKKGDLVYSRPLEKHKFVFLKDGVFIAMATEARTHKNYEEDTTREEF